MNFFIFLFFLLINLTSCQHFSKSGPKTIDEFDLEISNKPDDFLLYYNRGLLYYNDRKFNQAFEDFNKSSELNPNHAETHIQKANIYGVRFDLKMAIVEISKAIDINKSNKNYYYKRALYYYQLKDYVNTIADLDVFLKDNKNEKDDDVLNAYTTRGYSYKMEGNIYMSIKDLDKAFDINWWFNNVSVLEKHIVDGKYNYQKFVKNADNLISEYSKLIEQKSSDNIALISRGYAYLAKKDFAKAEQDFKLASTLAPKYSFGHTSLGIFYEEQGNYAYAISMYNQAILAYKDDWIAVERLKQIREILLKN